MEGEQFETLLRLGHPRFRNFPDAADAALGALAGAIPGTVVSGRLEQTLAGVPSPGVAPRLAEDAAETPKE